MDTFAAALAIFAAGSRGGEVIVEGGGASAGRPADHTGDGPTHLAPATELFGELDRPALATIEQAGEPDPTRLHPRDLELILELVGRVGIGLGLGKRLEAGGELVRLRQLPGGLRPALGGQVRRLAIGVALLG